MRTYVLAALNNAVLALMDYLGVASTAVQTRAFNARPPDALALRMRSLWLSEALHSQQHT